jgi:hypothetical protein
MKKISNKEKQRKKKKKEEENHAHLVVQNPSHLETHKKTSQIYLEILIFCGVY